MSNVEEDVGDERSTMSAAGVAYRFAVAELVILMHNSTIREMNDLVDVLVWLDSRKR